MYRKVLDGSRLYISFHSASEHKISRVPHLEIESDASLQTPLMENERLVATSRYLSMVLYITVHYGGKIGPSDETITSF